MGVDQFAALAEAMPVKVNQAPSVGPENKENFDLGKTGPIGSLIITYDWKMIFPFMTIFRNRPDGVRRLYGISVFRIEE